MIGDNYVLNLGATPATSPPCGCDAPSYYVASLIVPLAGGCKETDLPASFCRCGAFFWSWRTDEYKPKTEGRG